VESAWSWELQIIGRIHLKVELQPNWYFGVAIYEVSWKNSDQLTLKATDKTIQLDRVLPD
jgi:hypothetical protein